MIPLIILIILFIVSFIIAVKCEDKIEDFDRALWFFFTGDYQEKKGKKK